MLNKALFISGSLVKKNPIIFNKLINYKPESLRIVYYHIVSKNEYPFYLDNKAISIDEFKEQIIFFKKYYDVIGLTDAINLAKNGRSLNRKLVITFDDGFTDNYSVAAPILSKLKCEATFFLIGNCIDNDDLNWDNKIILINKVRNDVLVKGLKIISKEFNLNINKSSNNFINWCYGFIPMEFKDKIINSLWDCTMDFTVDEYLDKYKPYMTVDQIKELCNQGFEFGSHSMSHPDFKKIAYEEFRNEIVNSKIKIERLINKKVNSFAYPYGRRSSPDFERRLLNENPNLMDTFLGTRNRLNNFHKNMTSWERDNLEFPSEIAMSRFLIVSALRSYI